MTFIKADLNKEREELDSLIVESEEARKAHEEFQARIALQQKLIEMRKAENMTQADVAAALHCSQQAYSNYELGQRDIPSDVLIALAELHKTNVDYILGITQVKTYYKKLR